ncbi:MAG: D-alanine--D-alanine ligase family protein [Acidimicrobiales bacterium]
MGSAAVIFGGPSPEHDVSVLTGLQAARALAGGGPGGEAAPPGGGGVRALYWARTGDWFEVDPGLEGGDFAEGTPRGAAPLRLVAAPGGGFAGRGGVLGKERPLELDVVVNCCHGGPGEDGTLQAALDLAGLAYTGPSAAGAALGMDKLAFGAVVGAAGLPCLPRALLPPGGHDQEAGEPGFPGPYIVKPRYGGSSIGIEVVEDLPTARARLAANPHLRRGAVVEPYRPDLYDVQVAIRSWPRLSLSAIERPLRSTPAAEILSYADKYVGGEGMASAPRELPASLPPGVEDALRDAALQVAVLAGVRGVARLDFLHGDGELYVNEVNTIPGSLARYLWVDPAVPFTSLLADMVAEARDRPPTHWTTAGADGTALRAAGTIAGKLG